MKVALQDNLWFHSRTPRGYGIPPLANYYRNGRPMHDVALRWGLTSSLSHTAKRRELRYLDRNLGLENVLLTVEWTGPGSTTDRVLHWILPVYEEFPALRWCIFYDALLHNGGEVLRLPSVKFSAAMTYLRHLFLHPQYFTVNYRPVVWTWAAGTVLHNPAEAETICGGEVQFVHDVFGAPTGTRLHANDIATGFVAAMPGQRPGRYLAVDVLERSLLEWRRWRERATVWPATSLQYYDRQFRIADGRGEPSTEILARDRADLDTIARAVVDTGRAYGGVEVTGVGTWNLPAEGSCVIPTKRKGPAFPPLAADGVPERLGHYRDEHTRAIARALR